MRERGWGLGVMRMEISPPARVFYLFAGILRKALPHFPSIGPASGSIPQVSDHQNLLKLLLRQFKSSVVITLLSL